jgi:hypothetical protein
MKVRQQEAKLNDSFGRPLNDAVYQLFGHLIDEALAHLKNKTKEYPFLQEEELKAHLATSLDWINRTVSFFFDFALSGKGKLCLAFIEKHHLVSAGQVEHAIDYVLQVVKKECPRETIINALKKDELYDVSTEYLLEWFYLKVKPPVVKPSFEDFLISKGLDPDTELYETAAQTILKELIRKHLESLVNNGGDILLQYSAIAKASVLRNCRYILPNVISSLQTSFGSMHYENMIHSLLQHIADHAKAVVRIRQDSRLLLEKKRQVGPETPSSPSLNTLQDENLTEEIFLADVRRTWIDDPACHPDVAQLLEANIHIPLEDCFNVSGMNEITERVLSLLFPKRSMAPAVGEAVYGFEEMLGDIELPQEWLKVYRDLESFALSFAPPESRTERQGQLASSIKWMCSLIEDKCLEEIDAVLQKAVKAIVKNAILTLSKKKEVTALLTHKLIPKMAQVMAMSTLEMCFFNDLEAFYLDDLKDIILEEDALQKAQLTSNLATRVSNEVTRPPLKAIDALAEHGLFLPEERLEKTLLMIQRIIGDLTTSNVLKELLQKELEARQEENTDDLELVTKQTMLGILKQVSKYKQEAVVNHKAYGELIRLILIDIGHLKADTTWRILGEMSEYLASGSISLFQSTLSSITAGVCSPYTAKPNVMLEAIVSAAQGLSNEGFAEKVMNAILSSEEATENEEELLALEESKEKAIHLLAMTIRDLITAFSDSPHLLNGAVQQYVGPGAIKMLSGIYLKNDEKVVEKLISDLCHELFDDEILNFNLMLELFQTALCHIYPAKEDLV